MEADDDILVDDEDANLDMLESQVKNEPSNYEAHLKYIRACRSAGELERLRLAREQMRLQFPLTPTLWLDWIQDEVSTLNADEHGSTHESNLSKIRQLFDLAVQDYTSFEVWLEYVQWACGTGNTIMCREIFERAVSAVGLHVGKGCLIWDAYREFESAMLSLLVNRQELNSSDSNDAFQSIENDAVSKQKSLVVSLFKRQLSLPLIGMDQSYEEYVQFLNGEPTDKTIEAGYQSALKTLATLRPFEERLLNCQQSDQQAPQKDTLRAYSTYLDFELGQTSPYSPPPRIKCLFERAITDNCLNIELWLRYLDWLDRKLKIKDEILNAYQRAVRNCPWSASIWQNYLLSLERLTTGPPISSDDDDPCRLVFEQALNEGGYTTALECSQLWLTRIYQIRRRLSAGPDYTELRNAFEQGAEFLKQKFSQLGWDSNCTYRQCWARMEGSLLKDLNRFRKIYDEIMSEAGNGKRAQAWLQYFSAEREFGGSLVVQAKEEENQTSCCWISYARKILVKATNSVSDYPELIFAQLLQFELEHGTLTDYDQAVQRVEQQRNRLKERSLTAKAKTGKSEVKFEASKKRYNAGESENTAKKDDKPSNNKKPKLEKPGDFNFVQPSTIPPHRPAAKKETVVMVGPSTSSSSTSRQQTAAGVDTSKYDRTVFVSNLDFAVGDDVVRSIFDDAKQPGHVTDIRLVMLRPGRSKGYGYVEFESPTFAAEALTLDRHKINGRPMYVSKCVDKQPNASSVSSASHDSAAPSFTYSTSLEKNKLFVKNLHGRTTEADLEQFFKPYGRLLSVRLVLHKSGQSKGLAYIEYADEQSANRALIATDQALLMGRKLAVALSNPPPKQPRTDYADSAESTRIPTQSHLLTPRTLAVNKPADHRRPHLTTGSSNATELGTRKEQNGVASVGRSNDEFRRLFMK